METTYDMSNEIDIARYLAAYDVKTLEERLRRRAEWIRYRMDELLRALDEGHSVNALGVLQSSGVELDSLCGQFEQAKAHQKAIERLAEALTDKAVVS